jgi:hypothetical protein
LAAGVFPLGGGGDVHVLAGQRLVLEDISKLGRHGRRFEVGGLSKIAVRWSTKLSRGTDVERDGGDGDGGDGASFVLFASIKFLVVVATVLVSGGCGGSFREVRRLGNRRQRAAGPIVSAAS